MPSLKVVGGVGFEQIKLSNEAAKRDHDWHMCVALHKESQSSEDSNQSGKFEIIRGQNIEYFKKGFIGRAASIADYTEIREGNTSFNARQLL